MDAAVDDQDVKLQRASADLLADLTQSLPPFLWRQSTQGARRIRRRVRARETDRIVALLEPFQELPQLLDPHLEVLLPVLAEALLEYHRSPSKSTKLPTTSLLTPLSTAICQILYTFCKIRGEKVIVRFLSAETKNLELLLSALEASENVLIKDENFESNGDRPWVWEERYVTLLWLSHLLLAPFDLSTISSANNSSYSPADIPGLQLPVDSPGVTRRVVPLAIKYLETAGKERDAAKILLVRIAMRRDMQSIGLLKVLAQWAVSRLRSTRDVEILSIYHYIGVLSFLGGLLVSSATTTDMDPYLLPIFRAVQQIFDPEIVPYKPILSSALARKIMIKLLRAISVSVSRADGSSLLHYGVRPIEIVENAIGMLLDALADNDTPVRLSASKALSVITLKLPAILAVEVVDAILESLNHNVRWQKGTTEDIPPTRDLTSVNPAEWHGLVLTLSHLLYRRSPPVDSLPDILQALLIGLSFEQRSSTGASIGTNVRDAACFGIWALSRRYTTTELLGVSTKSIFAAKKHDASLSMLQILATELVASASLDPAGNIRRGSSAALQELIGRHPNTVVEGIAVVQAVDYHSIALRVRAIQEVALEASGLSETYWNSLFNELLSWRGVGDPDATSRRNAAIGIGGLANKLSGPTRWDKLSYMIGRIHTQLRGLKLRQLNERHGLYLSLAAVTSAAATTVSESSSLSMATTLAEALAASSDSDPLIPFTSHVADIVGPILEDASTTTYRKPELIAEGVSNLIGSFSLAVKSSMPTPEQMGHYLSLLEKAPSLLELWLHRSEKDVTTSASSAAYNLIQILPYDTTTTLISNWISCITELQTGRTGQGSGFIFALATMYPYIDFPLQQELCTTLISRWGKNSDIESRVAILQSLTDSEILDGEASRFVELIAGGLDDYTNDTRGDVGSLVRTEAARAVGKVFETMRWDLEGEWYMDLDKFGMLYGRLLRLAAEKLDKVRSQAQRSLAVLFKSQSSNFKPFQEMIDLGMCSSKSYFRYLLDLQVQPWLLIPDLTSPAIWITQLLEGYITSVDTASEDLIRASRAALVEFCANSEAAELVAQSLLEVAKRNEKDDRILVPVLETLSFLFEVGILGSCSVKWRNLYILNQKAHYKTGNIRKLEVSVKLYGALVEVYPDALQKLTSMLQHPFPKIRNEVADTLFAIRGVGKGVDWIKAGKGEVEKLKGQLVEVK